MQISRRSFLRTSALGAGAGVAAGAFSFPEFARSEPQRNPQLPGRHQRQ